jgi:uncharacterized protein (DUF433 family)
MDYKNFIVIDPNIRFGKPYVKNTRISVYDILGWLGKGMSIEDVIDDFPELNKESILACLTFASDRDHKLKTA